MIYHTKDKFKAANAFWLGLKRLGISPAVVLRQAKLPLTIYDGQKNLVTTEQFFALWRAVGELASDPAAGLKIATQLEIAALPPSSLAAFYARDYRDALYRTARFKQLCTPEEMRIIENKDEVVIEMKWLYAPEGEKAAPPLLTDATFASFVELGRRGTEKHIQPKRVELKQPFEASGFHNHYFDCPIKFRARHDKLVMHKTDLDRPFVTYNSELLEVLNSHLERSIDERKEQSSIGEQVKWTLKRLMAGGSFEISAVARELGIGARTLQRRITDEGKNFRQLFVETRQELARQYLAQPSVEINEIAYLLGYEDANSFYRAFRTWEGMTPAGWRAKKASET